jgi:rhodanese-related sulfurtransferase
MFTRYFPQRKIATHQGPARKEGLYQAKRVPERRRDCPLFGPFARVGCFVVLAVILWTGCTVQPAPINDEAKRATIDAMYEEYRTDFPDVPEITAEDLVEALAAKEITLVDVRSKKERAVSMIPGAITIDAFEEDRETYTRNRIVAYCTIGARSGAYAESLRAAGIDAANLRGSILAWAHTGQPLENAEGPTKRVHVYGAKWNLLPSGFEGTW